MVGEPLVELVVLECLVARLYDARRRAGFTQAELGRLLGTSARSVGYVERGDARHRDPRRRVRAILRWNNAWLRACEDGGHV